MSIESELVFGRRVSASKTLHRRKAQDVGISWIRWVAKPSEIANGIFLGFETLRNGYEESDKYGASFNSYDSIRSAIVCPGHNLNPVYVPLDAIELVREDKE